MKFKSFLIILACFFTTLSTQAQSETTRTLKDNHHEALSFFFYNNTLRMLNQSEDKAFDELIKDIDKMQFVMIDKKKERFEAGDFKKLLTKYKAESFEAVMTSRHAGKNFDVFLKEKDGKTKGVVVLVNDAENLYVLDIVGFIALNKVTSFFGSLDENSEIGKKIKQFTKDKI